MVARNARRARLCVTLVLVALAAAEPAGAAAPANLADDGNGKRWRQLTETTGLTPNEVAQVCPRGGKTRCSGSIGCAGPHRLGVGEAPPRCSALMGYYEPAILTANPSVVAGPEYLFSAMDFLEDMTPTMVRHRIQLPPLVRRRLDVVGPAAVRKRRVRLVSDRRVLRRRAGHQP